MRNGGVSQHFLNIVLTDCNCRGEERSTRADHRHNVLSLRHKHVKRSGTRNEIHTRRYHRRGMDQRRNGSGARHRIWQPDVKWNLRGFPSHAHQHEQCDRHDHPGRRYRDGRRGFEDFVKLEGAEIPEHQETRDQEAEVTDTIDNKCFFSRIGISPRRTPKRIQLVPKADQQEGAKPHAFPTDEEHHERVAADKDHHRRDEQVQENKETSEASFIILEAHILVHVSDGVDVNECADTRNDQHQCGRE